MLEHGGRLREAAKRYAIPLGEWIDLSAAINPHGYTPPPIPAEAWLRLPESGDGLESAAADYYGNTNLLPVPGSQAAIQALPKLFPPHRVAVLAPGYNEHAHAWQAAGHEVVPVGAAQLEAATTAAGGCETLVLCNPNNPDAARIPRERLLALTQRGVRLIVDEAFADTSPETAVTSLAGTAGYPDLIALRSLGKFFGLAGARAGFAFAAPGLLAKLAEAIGPWAISGPARVVAAAALRDTHWQAQARRQLAANGARLSALLSPLGKVQSLPLFTYVLHADAVSLGGFLARHGILVRRLDGIALRFGLPGDEAAWQRLTAALNEWKTK